MDKDELLKTATARFYSDPQFNEVVETAIMVVLAKNIIPGKHNEIREIARQAASFALILAERDRDESSEPPPKGAFSDNLVNQIIRNSGY